jgi:hypothetical protein
MFDALRETVVRALPWLRQTQPSQALAPGDDETTMHSPCL